MLLTLALLATTPALTDGLEPADGRLAEALAGRRERSPLVAHFDPAAVDAKAVEEVLRRSAAHLDRIRSTLSVRTSGNIHLFLHADEAAMREATGAQPHWSAFSRGRAIHQPVGFTGAHELAHVVASMLPVPEEAPGPDAFLREGWATAMQKTDRSIDLHDWASVAARTGRLPSPRALRKAWPEG
ncbi:MAG: hypothetical protein ACYTDX_08060, partial [Planctomycetota bacterium]